MSDMRNALSGLLDSALGNTMEDAESAEDAVEEMDNKSMRAIGSEFS